MFAVSCLPYLLMGYDQGYDGSYAPEYMLNGTSDGYGKIMLNDFFLVEVGTQKSKKKCI